MKTESLGNRGFVAVVEQPPARAPLVTRPQLTALEASGDSPMVRLRSAGGPVWSACLGSAVVGSAFFRPAGIAARAGKGGCNGVFTA